MKKINSKVNKKFLSIITILIIIISSYTISNAYDIHNYRLNGGIEGRLYYINDYYYTYKGTTRNYGSVINNAISRWNSAVDTEPYKWENLYFSRTTEKHRSVVDFYVVEENGGAPGRVEFYGGGKSATKDFPNWNWTWCKVIINAVNAHDLTYNELHGLICHEFGHTLGLKHSGKVNTVMCRSIENRSCVPVADDIAGVRALY